MALLKMKLDGEKYQIDPDKLKLGEMNILKEQFGMEDLTSLNVFDPVQLTGLFFIAVKRAHPEKKPAEIQTQVEDIEIAPVIEDLTAQIEAAIEKARIEREDPPVPGANGTGTAPGRGSRATTRKTGGTRSSKPKA